MEDKKIFAIIVVITIASAISHYSGWKSATDRITPEASWAIANPKQAQWCQNRQKRIDAAASQLFFEEK